MTAMISMRCPRCKSRDLCYDSVLSAQFEKQVYICLRCGNLIVSPPPAPQPRTESKLGMRHVTSGSITELRVFPTGDEVIQGARLVAAQLRAQPGQPRFFLVVFAGDGGFRGCFFPDDPYHREIVSEVASDAGLGLTAKLNEQELLGGEK